MAEFTWTFDAQTGTYKNHALSNRLMEAAARKFILTQFTQKVDGFGKKQGETINLPRYDKLDVPTDPALDEQLPIPVDKLSMATRAITVEEWGRGVQVTNLARDLSKFDPHAAGQKALMEQMKTVMENKTAAAFKTAKVCAIPTSSTAITWDTDGTPSTTALSALKLAHLGVIRDYMANDLHIPPYEGESWVAVLTTRALRGIKGDTAWQSWMQYLKQGDALYKSEVGMIESFRVVEINLETALSNSVGSGSVLGEGLFFGDESVARVEAAAPELRYEPNYKGDFGRFQAVAWRGVLAFATFWDTANDYEAKIVRLTSA